MKGGMCHAQAWAARLVSQTPTDSSTALRGRPGSRPEGSQHAAPLPKQRTTAPLPRWTAVPCGESITAPDAVIDPVQLQLQIERPMHRHAGSRSAQVGRTAKFRVAFH